MTDPEASNPAAGETKESMPMDHAAIVEGLLDPKAYPHPVDDVTHLQCCCLVKKI